MKVHFSRSHAFPSFNEVLPLLDNEFDMDADASEALELFQVPSDEEEFESIM